jgi:hypothetical protein
MCGLNFAVAAEDTTSFASPNICMEERLPALNGQLIELRVGLQFPF